MSTDTRTVVEIMGWRARGGYGAEHWWWDVDGNEITTFGPDPTPDDMLAWLREQGWQVHLSCGVVTDVDIYLTKFGGVETVDLGVEPTLHAALQAAVRAVAATDG